MHTQSPFRYEIVKTYPQRGPLQQYRIATSTAFYCVRCDVSKKSKLISTISANWKQLICNGCYGRLVSMWNIKAGEADVGERQDDILAVLRESVSASELDRQLVKLTRQDRRMEELCDESRRLVATSVAVLESLHSATDLDWSVAIIPLCKAVEVEANRLIVQPLRDALTGVDLSVDIEDKRLTRVAKYLAGVGKPPELGTLAWFIEVCTGSSSRNERPTVSALRTISRSWPGADWLFDRAGFPAILRELVDVYRNPAAHTELLSRDAYERCSELVSGKAGLLWRLMVSTEPRR